MNLGIADKTALITGGASGIGLAAARLFAQEGTELVLLDIDESKLKEAKRELRSKVRVETLVTDLTDREAVTKARQEVEEKLGTLHIIVNSAGITGQTGNFLDLDDDAWTETFETNLMSAVRVCREFLPMLAKEKWGRVVLVASEDAVQPYTEEMPYCVSKAGIINLTKNLSKAFARDGILVNCVSPAFIKTPMTDAMMEKRAEEQDMDLERAEETFLKEKRPHLILGRRGRPEEVAAAILFLCSEPASFVVGSTYRVDGGSVAGISL
jgi:3-oxoacyl-[acyl-carrier protein] reductase